MTANKLRLVMSTDEKSATVSITLVDGLVELGTVGVSVVIAKNGKPRCYISVPAEKVELFLNDEAVAQLVADKLEGKK